MSRLFALLSGLVFAAGLALSGMTAPQKVLGFLDVAGDWDPSLAFVMGGALAVYAPAYRFITRRKYPLIASAFQYPTARVIDGRLLMGAALFGIGWGLAGMCPGPAIVAVGTGQHKGLLFATSMLVGMAAFHAVETLRARRVERSLRSPLRHAPDA